VFQKLAVGTLTNKGGSQMANVYQTQIDNFNKMKASGKTLTAEQQALLNNAVAKLQANTDFVNTNPTAKIGDTTVGQFQENIDKDVNNFPTMTPTVTPTVTPVVAPTITPTPTTYNPLADLDALKEAQRAKNIADLSAKRDASLSVLSEQRAGITPQYQGQRTTQDTMAKINAKNFAEYMAQRGQNNVGADSGTFNQFKQVSDVANMGALSNLYAQEQSAIDKNARDVAGVQTSYQSDLASANAGVEAQALQNKIDAMQTEQQRQDSLAKFDYEKSQDLIAQNTAKAEKEKSDFVNTIGQYYDNYQSQIDKITNDNDTTNDWQLPFLKAARVEKQQAQAAATQTAQAKAIADQKAETKAVYDAALKRWETAGYVVTDADAKILGVAKGSKTESYAKAIMANTVAQQNANTASINANKTSTANEAKLSTYDSYISKLYVTPNKNELGQSTGKYTTNRTAIAKYLGSLASGGVSDDIITSLETKYGITASDYLKAGIK